MTAIIGLTLPDGVFLAADTRRTDVDTGIAWKKAVKKIHPLNNRLVSFTAGLGTQGSEARKKLESEVGRLELEDIDQIIECAKPIFRSFFNPVKSLAIQHNQHLNFSIAGIDAKTRSGRIVTIDNFDDYDSVQNIKVNYSVFARGSQSQRLNKLVHEVIIELQGRGKGVNLDLFAYEVMKRMTAIDPHVGFPIQIVQVKNEIIERFPVEADKFTIDNRFYDPRI